MAKPVFILAWAVLLLGAGCATAPRPSTSSKPLPENWDADLGPAHEAEPDLALPTRPQPAPPKVIPKSPTPLTTAETGLVSLNRWAVQNGLPELRFLPLTPTPAYALITAKGKFAVQAGRLGAFWDGLEVRLGFAPQLFGNQVFLHALDIRKVLEPLVHGVPLAAGPNRVIVLDPGHGGSNAGTRSALDGRNEKDYTLDWARRLAPLLEQNGWQVFLTRTSDVDVSLLERTAFAEAHHADLFLSLHFNASGGSSEPAGVETYCVTPTGMPSSVTRGYNDDPRQVFPNNAFDLANLQYAVRLQRAMLTVSGTTDRGVRRARYQSVLCGQNRPAVLVEGGYLSNPTEAKRIADPAYRQQLAEAVAKALP